MAFAVKIMPVWRFIWMTMGPFDSLSVGLLVQALEPLVSIHSSVIVSSSHLDI